MQRVLGLGGGGVARRVGVLGAHRLAAKAAARPVAMLMPAALRHAGCSELTHALAGTAPSRAKREVTEAPRPRTWHARAGLRVRVHDAYMRRVRDDLQMKIPAGKSRALQEVRHFSILALAVWPSKLLFESVMTHE